MIADIVTKTIKKNMILNYASSSAMLAFGPFLRNLRFETNWPRLFLPRRLFNDGLSSSENDC